MDARSEGECEGVRRKLPICHFLSNCLLGPYYIPANFTA
jgi:hypothetical protein